MKASGPDFDALPTRLDGVLLDAGGVLLDLDYAYLQRLVRARHAEVSTIELSRAEALARREVERTVLGGGSVGELWRDYFHAIIGHVGVPAAEHDAIIDALWEAHQRIGLWTVAIPGAREAVDRLKDSGLRVGVVSNAEGRVERDLASAGFDGAFETVVDSSLVGVEKPDPEIFRIALERMKGLDPNRVVYVGDLPSVDVAGARAAGLAAVLVDRHELYPDVDAPRLRSIDELPALLRR